MSRLAPHLSRRALFQALAAFSAASALPASFAACKSSSGSPAPNGFFTDDERRALGALADAVIPPDDTPGGKALGAVDYVERLMTALDDASAPKVFAGGPYSGRVPNPDGKGGAASTSPPNDFQNFLPLDRVTLAAWKLALFGSSALDGGLATPGVAPVVGLRDQLKQGLAQAIKDAHTPLDQQDAKTLAQSLNDLDRDFKWLLVELVSEAAFAAPEYGGNKDLSGWKLTHYEGDSMPLGFSVFDETSGTYKERAEFPVSTPNPGADPEPLTDDVRAFIAEVVQASGGKTFS